MDMHHSLYNGRRQSSPRQNWEDMPMPGNFPDTPAVDDLDALNNHLKQLGLDTNPNAHSRGDQLRAQLNQSTYEGWTLYRGEPKTPGAERTWATATICKMPLPQAELIDLVQKQKRKSVTEAYNELTMVKRQHIDNLIEERKQESEDSKYDWICVYINSATREVRSAFGPRKALTISIAIVLCKQLKHEVLNALRTAQVLKERKLRNAGRHDRAIEHEIFGDSDDSFNPAHNKRGLGLNVPNNQQHPQNRTQGNPQNQPRHNSQDRILRHPQHPQHPQHPLQGHPQGPPHPHPHGNLQNHPQGSHQTFPPDRTHARSAVLPPQDQRHANHHPPHNDPRMMPERSIPGGPLPENRQMPPFDESRPLPQQQQQQQGQRMQPEMAQITPGHHPQGQRVQPEMMQIPPPPIGPHQSQPRILPPPQHAHSAPQHERLPPGVQLLNQGSQHPRQHHPEQEDLPPGVQVLNQGSQNPRQQHSRNEHPPPGVQVLNQGLQHPNQHHNRHGHEELPPGVQILNQGHQNPSHGHPRHEQPPPGTQVLNQSPRYSRQQPPVHGELPPDVQLSNQPRLQQRKQKPLPPRVLNSEKPRRDQVMVEQWLDEESDISDDDSYLFEPENASSMTENSFSSEEYDKCDFSPDDEIRRRPFKSRNREKSKSSERSGHRQQRHSLGYRTHERPSRKAYLAELPRHQASRYRAESIDILPSNSMHNRSGKLTRSETVSYPSRRQSLSLHQRGLRSYSPDLPSGRISRSEIEWEMEQREQERAHHRYLESQRLAKREVEARLHRDMADRLDREGPGPVGAQLAGYTPQRVLDTYEKYDRMRRLDGNRRQSYMEQLQAPSYPRDYPPHHRERSARR
ncbi:hypothetical protein FQN49_004855 [Arthroderma sp. PD_2]|nr:hypothetical protein FQN49_004855 [Arthroderma sp. PD_2]